MTSKPRSFDEILSELVEIERTLRRFDDPRGRKLNAKTWLRIAMENALASHGRLDEVEKLLASPHNGNAAALAGRLMREVCFADTYVSPPAWPLKIVAVFGREDTLAELNLIGVTPLEVLALASRWATQRRPEAFGTAAADYAKTDEEARKRRGAVRLELENAIDFTNEIVIDLTLVPADLREQGLARIRFRRWPRLTFTPDWPLRLVAAVIAEQDAGKPKASAAA